MAAWKTWNPLLLLAVNVPKLNIRGSALIAQGFGDFLLEYSCPQALPREVLPGLARPRARRRECVPAPPHPDPSYHSQGGGSDGAQAVATLDLGALTQLGNDKGTGLSVTHFYPPVYFL